MASPTASQEPRELRFFGDRYVEMWLWFIAALIIAMVVVGGATRLTESGLSITEWQPIIGAIPPLNQADWMDAFQKYQQIPQYHALNQGMDLAAFKSIFWWEWSHRSLGRFIGFAVAVPLVGFWSAGRLRSGLPSKLLGVLALGGLQGAIGWYMVSSGLTHRIDVSQYRLALHLAMALVILSCVVWLALEEREARDALTPSASTLGVKRGAVIVLALIALQIVLGAFVAGLKAGFIYNTWPDMSGRFFPSDYWLNGRGWLSFFESLAAAQFNHRMVAYIVLAAVLFQAVRATSQASGGARRSAIFLAIAVVLQVTIGILTLLHHVPLSLGLLHQGGAAIVLTLAIWHLYSTRQSSDVISARDLKI